MGNDKNIAEAALAPMVRVLSDIRLALLLLLVVTGSFEWLPTASALLAVPCSCLLLFRWGRDTRRIISGVYFVAWDAVATAVVVMSSLYLAGVGVALAVGYLSVSALLTGIVAGDRAMFAWCILVSFGALEHAQHIHSSSAVLVMAVAASVILALLGRRQTLQVGRVELLAADAVEARSRQYAAEERLALARDLHDTVAKSAAGVRMLAEALANELGTENSEHARDAVNLLEAADALSAEARSVLDELRSVPTGDLREQLRQDAETWGRRVGMDVSLEVSGYETVTDADATWQAQRVLGELLANVEKHSAATQVRVRIEGGEELRLMVEDNGVGLPRRILEDQTSLRGSGHYGLCGVSERLAAIGGRLALTAGPEGGAQAVAEIPLPVTLTQEQSVTTVRAVL